MNKNIQGSSSSEEKLGIPVVAVLGHVDHGKTSLLDTIRKTSIAKREHGGITQKIGASSIELTHDGKPRRITFIDTPGHETFTKMRSRGVEASDIGLLIVSSSDGVMPQTKESLQHLRVSSIPVIVVLTKADLPDKNPEKVKQQLEKEGLLLEGRGGDIPVIEVSAQTGFNIPELLELILLVFDMKQQESYTTLLQKPFKAIIIESKLDPKSGSTCSFIIKQGRVSLRDELMCEDISARVRSLITDRNEQVSSAEVGEAVEVLGFEKVPPVGSLVTKKSETVDVKKTVQNSPAQKSLSYGLKEESTHDLSVIICADTRGSIEAIISALPKRIKIIAEKTGDISEADVFLAKSTGAIIIGFNTRVRSDVEHLAYVEKVLIRNYTIIYELLDEIQDALEGKRLSMEEKIYGVASILATFPFEKTTVLGIKVKEGRIARGDKIRIVRGEEIIGESTIVSLRQGRETISKVEQGKEAGILISPFLDFTIGDMIISHS